MAPLARAARSTARASTTPRPSGRCRVAGVRRAAVVVEVDVRAPRAARAGSPGASRRWRRVRCRGSGRARRGRGRRARRSASSPRPACSRPRCARRARAGTPRARRTCAAARPARAHRAAPRTLIVGVDDVGLGADRGRSLEVPPVDGQGVPPVSLSRAPRLEVVPRSVDGEAKAALQGRAAIVEQQVGSPRGDRQRRVSATRSRAASSGSRYQASLGGRCPAGRLAAGRACGQSTRTRRRPRGDRCGSEHLSLDEMFDSARY